MPNKSSSSSSPRPPPSLRLPSLLLILLLVPTYAFLSPIAPPSHHTTHRLHATPSPDSSTSSDTSPPSYFAWLGRQVELKLRPKPYQGLRLRLEKDLAVLLMRSSYEVMDELDCYPMDAYQREFFLFRQSEWEDYVNEYPPLTVKQGELTMPAYFDFISFAQYVTLNAEMKNGAYE